MESHLNPFYQKSADQNPWVLKGDHPCNLIELINERHLIANLQEKDKPNDQETSYGNRANESLSVWLNGVHVPM